MAIRKPTLPGDTAWQSAQKPPSYAAIRQGQFWFGGRRYPASIRLLGAKELVHLNLDTSSCWDATRRLFAPGQRKLANPGPSDEELEHVTRLKAWLLLEGNHTLRSWWGKRKAWRSPTEFTGYRALERGLGSPHVSPFEIANLALPDDICMDYDVVRLAAWTQGVSTRDEPTHDTRHGRSIREGLRKLLSSPWVCFALAAPNMAPGGALFGNCGFFDSSLRMEWLLRHPYEASEGELEVILRSGSYKAGYARAVRARNRGSAMNPPGGWYANGSIISATGTVFIRGGRPKDLRRR